MRGGRLGLALVLVVLAVLVGAYPSTADGHQCNSSIDVECPSVAPNRPDGGTTTTSTTTTSGPGNALPGEPTCPQCQYVFTPSCQGGPDESAACGNATTSCSQPDEILMRVYRRQPPNPDWELIGTVCRGPSNDRGGPSIGELVRREVQDLFDKPRPSYQPVRGAIVNLPTLFASGQPARYEGEPHDLAGFTVQVFATATWEWTFEPGVTRTFDQPGGPYPNYSVAHTYEDTGTYEVELVTNWSAEYTVNGEGPFPVPGGPITQTAELTVDVREARAVLVAD